MATSPNNDPESGVTLRGAPTEQKLFGRYTLRKVLGRGGMGVVWLAHDDELARNVAMKFLPDMIVRDREAVEDLKRETRRSLDLTHHHIVRIYDFTQDDQCAAIIMEYVDGESLSAMKAQQEHGCFSVTTIQAWVSHFCQAMDYAHRQARVVHRDLKPANLMINGRGELKVTDFGISRSVSDSMTRVSMSNSAGTLAYMAPEQALGSPPAFGDDVYAFGATVYDLLTGRPPFFRGNLQVQLETVAPPPMETRRAELGNSGEPIPALWEEVIAACLAKRPQDRPQGMMEIASLLGVGNSTNGGRLPTGRGSGAAHGGPSTATTNRTATGTEKPTAKTAPAAAARPPAPSTYILQPTRAEDVLLNYTPRVSEPPVRPPAAKPTPAAPAAEPPAPASAAKPAPAAPATAKTPEPPVETTPPPATAKPAPATAKVPEPPVEATPPPAPEPPVPAAEAPKPAVETTPPPPETPAPIVEDVTIPAKVPAPPVEAPPVEAVVPPAPRTEPPPPPAEVPPPPVAATPPPVAATPPPVAATPRPPDSVKTVLHVPEIPHAPATARHPAAEEIAATLIMPAVEMPAAAKKTPAPAKVPAAAKLPPPPDPAAHIVVSHPPPSSSVKIAPAIGSGGRKKSSNTGLILGGVGAIVLVGLLGIWAATSGGKKPQGGDPQRKVAISQHIEAANTALKNGSLDVAGREIDAVKSLDPADARLGELQNSLQQETEKANARQIASKAATDKAAAEAAAAAEKIAMAEKQRKEQLAAALAATDDAIEHRDPAAARKNLAATQQFHPAADELEGRQERIKMLEADLAKPVEPPVVATTPTTVITPPTPTPSTPDPVAAVEPKNHPKPPPREAPPKGKGKAKVAKSESEPEPSRPVYVAPAPKPKPVPVPANPTTRPPTTTHRDVPGG